MKTDRKFLSSRKAPFLASFTLAFALAAGNAGAGIPVTDVGNGAAHWTNSISTYISKIEAFAEHAKEYTREIERIRNLATRASSLISGLSSLTMSDPQPRPLDHGMKRCDPDFSGFSMADIFRLIAPSLASSVPEQQRTICKQIVRLQNEKFNENVRLLQVLRNRVGEIDNLTSNFQAADSTGTQQSNLGQGTLILNKIMTDIQYSQAVVKIYENSIASLKEDQMYLAEEALSGKKKSIGESLLATGAQTLALCGGLIAAKSDGSDFSCTP